MSAATLEEIETKPLSINRIIVALDLTKHCEATVHYAARMARWYHASLCVAYVFWPPMFAEGEYSYLVDKEQKEFYHRLNGLANQVRAIVPEVKSALLVGEPPERLARLARDTQADLIVTSSYNPRVVTQLFNLDNALRIVHQAPCPVLVYHEADNSAY
jgi:nucleotide-binding universal stress UspA family protein